MDRAERILLAAPFKVRKERAKACCIPFEVFDSLAEVSVVLMEAIKHYISHLNGSLLYTLSAN